MVDEQTSGTEEGNDGQEGAAQEPERLTQAVRRERLGALAGKIGEHAQQDGDVVVVEAGEPVVLHIELDREGTYTLSWWATALTENSHHRWRDVANEILRDGESIHTSALGGGYLVEIVRTTRDESEALAWAGESAHVERTRELLTTFPEEVAKLPAEPVPDYLLPPEPELPPLGEVEEQEEPPDWDEDSEPTTE